MCVSPDLCESSCRLWNQLPPDVGLSTLRPGSAPSELCPARQKSFLSLLFCSSFKKMTLLSSVPRGDVRTGKVFPRLVVNKDQVK